MHSFGAATPRRRAWKARGTRAWYGPWPVIGVVLGALGALLPARPLAAQRVEYHVIVNAANPITTISRDDLSRIFLKQMTRWPEGGGIAAADLAPNSPVRERFTRDVHGRSVSAIRAYWHRQIFTGHAVPPVERASDAEMLEFVARDTNAIGYVSAATPLGRTVRVLVVRAD